jgi:DNA-binding Xre family transcriptional regulator
MKMPKPDGLDVPSIKFLSDRHHSERRDINPVDRRVGHQIRSRRIELGIDEESLALALGVSIYQLNKFEAGLKRIGAKKILELCDALSCKPGYFFGIINLRLVKS